MANETIQASEYEKYMALRAQIEKGVDEAESEFMLATYKQLNAVMARRQVAVERLQIMLKNKAINQKAKAKREHFKAEKAKAKHSA
jgi:hypothetical protein